MLLQDQGHALALSKAVRRKALPLALQEQVQAPQHQAGLCCSQLLEQGWPAVTQQLQLGEQHLLAARLAVAAGQLHSAALLPPGRGEAAVHWLHCWHC